MLRLGYLVSFFYFLANDSCSPDGEQGLKSRQDLFPEGRNALVSCEGGSRKPLHLRRVDRPTSLLRPARTDGNQFSLKPSSKGIGRNALFARSLC